MRPLKVHSGEAIDRQRLNAIVMWATRAISELDHNALGDLQLTRALTRDDAVEEMYSYKEYGRKFDVSASPLPVAFFEIDSGDSHSDITVYWAARFTSESDNTQFVLVMPFGNSVQYAEGFDLESVDQAYYYASTKLPREHTVNYTGIPSGQSRELSGCFRLSTIRNVTIGFVVIVNKQAEGYVSDIRMTVKRNLR